MTKQKDLITNRFNSLRFCRLCHEIVKYHPEFYDDNGRYLKEEWTSFDDVGRVMLFSKSLAVSSLHWDTWKIIVAKP